MILSSEKRWVAFFSHTGTEIYNLSNRLKRVPDRIVVNKSPGDETINEDLLWLINSNNIDLVYTKNRPDAEDYDRLIKDHDSVVTLHGWMRIVPAVICGSYKIYNLHPGLITKYPELKGEAMCSGTPLVATDGGALPEVTGADGETVFRCTAGDAGSLAATIAAALDNPERRDSVGLAGRQRVLERWTWRRCAEMTVDQYREVLAMPANIEKLRRNGRI